MSEKPTLDECGVSYPGHIDMLYEDSARIIHIPARGPDDTWCLVMEVPDDFTAAEWQYADEVRRVLRESGPDNPVVLAKPASIHLSWLRDCPRATQP